VKEKYLPANAENGGVMKAGALQWRILQPSGEATYNDRSWLMPVTMSHVA
jgi:hypothetical protein